MRRPRLLILVTLAEAGGAQSFVAALASGLQERYEIHVGAHGPGGALVEVCAGLGLEFHHVSHLRREIDPPQDARAVPEISRLAARVRPDLVQVNSAKAALLARVALARGNAPVVYTVHGWAFSGRRGLDGMFFGLAERATAPLADAIVCVSEWDRRLALQRGLGTPANVHVIHNGIEAPDTPPSRGPWPDRAVVACTARLAPPKHPELLLDALARPALSSWRLRLIGDGPGRAALEAHRRRLGLEERVEILGQRRDVLDLLADADAFALPTDWEGLPISILEAMAAGLPVVASRVGGIPEEVVDGVTGYLVRRRDLGDLCGALERLHADGAAAREMGLAGHRRVRDVFGLERMVERYDELFRGLIASGRRLRRIF